MKIEIEEVSLLKIDRQTALKLKNEINQATGGTAFNTDKYPVLHEIYQLINANFDSYKSGTHYISKRED